MQADRHDQDHRHEHDELQREHVVLAERVDRLHRARARHERAEDREEERHARRASMFHVFIMPRCSWMIAECRNAVAVNHGMKPAFSTGSHAQ